MKKIASIFLILLCYTSHTLAQSISVNNPANTETNLSAEELIQNVLVSGSSCVNVTLTNLQENPDGVSDLAQRSWGYFNANGSNFTFDEGVILSSGFAVSAEGPNDFTGSSDGFSTWTGDIDLETILNNQYGTTVTTNNATVFEFTFVSSLSEITFDFLFASEEYENQWECSDTFRDGFAFLIKGPGIPDDSGAPFGGTNVAAVTGSSNVPVSTATIHLDPADDPINGFLCGIETQGVNYFPEFYVSNDNDNANDLPIEFDGATVSLTTAQVAIIPNETYTVKMVIADRGDSSFDSAVFLKAGSFNIGTIDLGDDLLIANGTAPCQGEVITLDAGENTDATYAWYLNGTLLPNETNATLDVTQSGVYDVEISFGSSDCIVTDQITIEFKPAPLFDLGENKFLCENDNLVLDASVTNGSDLSNISYKWFLDGVEISGETNPTFTVTQPGVYAAEVTGNECISTDEVTITGVNFTVDIQDEVFLCGEVSYEIVPLIEGADATNATYLWSTGETTPTITVTQSGVYTVEVTIDTCVLSDDVLITIGTIPEIALGNAILKCAQDTEILQVEVLNLDPAQVSYQWFVDGGLISGETAQTLEVVNEGIYSVEVNNQGCIATTDIEVSFYDNENCVITQGISPDNGDGLNDFLDLEFLNDKIGIEKISIFNRLGNLVYEQKNYINQWRGQDENGNDLPVGTYFYIIQLNSQDPITGWIYINK